MTDPPSAEIRAAAPEEATLLSDLAFRSKADWGYAPEFMEACRLELTVSPGDIRPDTTFLLAAGGNVLGFYTLQRLSSAEVELGHLFVEPSALGHGHGRRLLDHACRQARRLGYRALVIQGDPNATGFYEACGAQRVGEKPSASIPGRSLPVFEVNLQRLV